MCLVYKMIRLFYVSCALVLLMTGPAVGQATPYIGYAFPAGGQQGTTVQVRLGGQRIDGVTGAVVSGQGVTARLASYQRQLSNQEIRILRDQLAELKPPARQRAAKGKSAGKGAKRQTAALKPAQQKLIARIEQRIKTWVNRPASVALASIAVVDVAIAADAQPGPRELRLVTSQGVTNPLVFYVGQVPEVMRKPLPISQLQVLGKEALALQKRPAEEIEEQIDVPSTTNGQISSGKVNRYRFRATQGQKLVMTVKARELVPYIADAVPGWFQPVLTLCDADGNEVAFSDDYRFMPDPTLFFEVPENGEYVLSIYDAIYRGREDFVYRITIGELPFVTSLFPLGGRLGRPLEVVAEGWNLSAGELVQPVDTARAGIEWVTVTQDSLVSNRLPVQITRLPEGFDAESNNDLQGAQKVKLPIVVNGRIDQPDDWDVYEIDGHQGQKVVVEVHARRLDSPLDSILKITDANGGMLAVNDDHEDPATGVNTHHADSYLMTSLPADGKYFIHIGDVSRNGGPAYGYRLRISPPRPDFELRVVPSSASFRSKGGTSVMVHAIRKDGFAGDIRLELKDSSEGFAARWVVLKAGQEQVRMALKTTLVRSNQPVPLQITGTAQINKREVKRLAVPAEDRMQAFLWRHLVPAEELLAFVYNPADKPASKRTPDPNAGQRPVKKVQATGATPPQFTKRQVAGRLRQLKSLYEEFLLTDAFYNQQVAECETAFD